MRNTVARLPGDPIGLVRRHGRKLGRTGMAMQWNGMAWHMFMAYVPAKPGLRYRSKHRHPAKHIFTGDTIGMSMNLETSLERLTQKNRFGVEMRSSGSGWTGHCYFTVPEDLRALKFAPSMVYDPRRSTLLCNTRRQCSSRVCRQCRRVDGGGSHAPSNSQHVAHQCSARPAPFVG